MKVIALKSRHIPGTGMLVPGQKYTLAEKLAKQLIEQKICEPVKPASDTTETKRAKT